MRDFTAFAAVRSLKSLLLGSIERSGGRVATRDLPERFDLVRRGLELDRVRDRRDVRLDVEIRVRDDRGELPEEHDLFPLEAELLFGLADGGVFQIPIAGLERAAGKRDLPAMR